MESSSDEDLSSAEILESLSEIDEVRPLRYDDYEKGYLQLLSTSCPVSDLSYTEFILRLTQIHQNRNHSIWVIEDIHVTKIIACATLLIEPKLGFGCGKRACIQDFVIHPEYAKYGFGVKMMKFLQKKAKDEDCYELSICCPREKYSFYHQKGFTFSNLELTQKLL